MVEDNAINLPSQEPMLTAVGRGIQAFANIEMFMADIYRQLMYPTHPDVSLVSFDAARNVETKLRIMRAVGPMRLTGPALKRFNQLMEQIKNRTGMRHKLAHWTTGYWYPHGPGTGRAYPQDTEVRLIPHYFSAKNLHFEPEDSIRIEQIEAFAKQCGQLSRNLLTFVTDLQRWIHKAEELGDIRAAKISGEEVSLPEA